MSAPFSSKESLDFERISMLAVVAFVSERVDHCKQTV